MRQLNSCICLVLFLNKFCMVALQLTQIINGKLVDKITTYDAYLDSDEMARKRFTYTVSADDESDD